MSRPPPGLLTLANGQLRLVIQPGLGAGLTQLSFLHRGRWEHVLRPHEGPAHDPEQMACCVLMPWSNRLYGGGFAWRGREVGIQPMRPGDRVPLHGDAWLAPWRVADRGPDRVTLEHESGPQGPFAYAGQVRYRIEGASLHVQLRAQHRGATPMPYGMGLHPWFTRDAHTELAFRSCGRWEPDASQAPREFRALHSAPTLDFEAPKPLSPELIDHVYSGWDGLARIGWPARGFALQMRAGPQAGHLVVYSPPALARLPAFVCLEPVTHRNDAHRSPDPFGCGLVELQPGESLELGVTMQVHAI